MLDKWINVYERRVVVPFIWLCWAALIFIVFMVTVDVCGRFFFNSPLKASVEISELLMPWIVWPCMAYALYRGAHVRVSLLTNLMSLRAKLIGEIITFSLGIAFFAIVWPGAWVRFWDSWVVREIMLAALPLPWYVGKFIYPVGVTLFILQFLIYLRGAIKGNLAPTSLKEF
jgi:TRAP-type C4-dicarboxylate transport system permease small subunit